MNLRVAGTQMQVTPHVGQNTAAITRAIRLAHAAHADILLTPEGSLSGYTPEFDPPAVEAGLAEVTGLARELQVGLALGTCFKEPDGLIYNQLRFYDAHGDYLGFHSKILRCGTMSKPTEGEINHYAATPLRSFALGGIRIGGLICNDLWANPQCTPMPDPHLTQQLADLGARVIFHAVNGGRPKNGLSEGRDGGEWSRTVYWPFHESNLRMRAAAGVGKNYRGLWIVTVDSCYPTTMPCAAPGGVIDPRGEWVCRTEPQGEQFFVQPIEL